MIQIINYSALDLSFSKPNIVVSKISEPRSLDEFEINIVDLNHPDIWCHQKDDPTAVDIQSDLSNLASMMRHRKTSPIIIILPKNYTFQYNWSLNIHRYTKTTELKNMLYFLTAKILKDLIDAPLNALFELSYENTITYVDSYSIESPFYFINGGEVLTQSHKSSKVTTIKIKKGLFLTTLNFLENDCVFKSYLRKCKLIKDKEEQPEWLHNFEFFDDLQQKERISNNKEIIRSCEEKIDLAKVKIEENDKFKSILYTQSDELVSVTFEILEKILDCDLSTFCDEKKEDFLIKKDGVTFIGEIKGVTSNIRSEHVSQLDVHYQSYIENLEQTSENIIALLIMDHQRNKPLIDREPVHENQIKLAERNGSLIIETITLLKLFEYFLSGKINSEQCVELLRTKTGILMESDFINNEAED